MERTMWTDARLDERFDGVDRRFDEVDRRFDDLERRMDAGFARVDGDLRELRTEIRDLRHLIFMLWGPTMLGIFATIATLVATNV
ncbi:MAG TPA: hypothetical protein VF245_03075 [Solirubrobacterales bacterium]